MTVRTQFYLAIMLIGVGAVRAWMHYGGVDLLIIEGCRGTNFTLPVGRAFLSGVHCWGCYAMLAGVAMVVYLGVSKISVNLTITQ